MSSFNAFLGGVRAGQAGHPAHQQRQSAFNEEMAYDPAPAVPAFGAGQMPPARAQTPRPQAEKSRRAVGRRAPHVSSHIFKGLDTAQREEVQAELRRKSQIVAALSALPVDQQAIGIQTYGRDFGIDAATLQQAAADPSTALATFSSSLQEAETMLEPSRSDIGLAVGLRPGADAVLDNARSYGNGGSLSGMEPPVTLMAQLADGQSTAGDPYVPAVPEPSGSLSQNNNRDVSSDPLSGEGQHHGVGDIRELVAREPDASFDIGKIAKGAEEAYDGGYGEGYSYAQPQGRFGANTNKCNLFVSDIVKAAGATVPFNMDKKTGVAWEPRAEQWADPTIPMEGWIVVKTPQKGDVVAQKRGYENNASASGHVGIVTRGADEQGYYRTISAGTEGVQEESSALSFPSFKPNVELGPVIFRRYVGVK